MAGIQCAAKKDPLKQISLFSVHFNIFLQNFQGLFSAQFAITVANFIGMRAAYSFKHPLFSDNVEFCGWVCMSARFSKCFFSGISCPIELTF